jgi:alkyldihydroxyacetonephosphate synthase
VTNSSPFPEQLSRDLARALPRIEASARDVDRSFYARDLWPRHHFATRSGETLPSAPGLVVWPKTADEVAELVRFATRRSVPVVPFGAGSGVCGAVLPREDTIVLDLKRMGGLRSTDRESMRMRVEAGALGLPLEEELERRGFTLGHFPSSILCSTAGGWVATRSAGQCSGYYGKIEDMVVSLECVTGTGEIVELERRRNGPDLSALVVGSEGSLGVITAATLRLHAAPVERAFAAFTFPHLRTGLEAMRAIFQAGLRPAVSRLYDPFDANVARSGRVKRKADGPHRSPAWRDQALRAAVARASALNKIVHGRLGERAFGGALLVLVFERAERGAAAREAARAQKIALELGARDEGEAPARRWMEHRYAISFRQSPGWRSGLFIDTFEVAAPWSKLEAVHAAVLGALGKHAFVMAHFSHAYPDGCCIYFSFAGAAKPEPAWEHANVAKYEAAWRDGMRAALEAGATISHHHGVGRSKAAGFAREIVGGVSTLRALKQAFDPQGILNPGVLVPDTDVDETRHAPFIRELELDETSRLAAVPGAMPLRAAQHTLGARGYRLAGDATSDGETIDAWLARGAPGTPGPFVDPVDHAVAGIALTLPSIGPLVVPPVPRRATGPDFGALAIGAGGAFGAKVEHAWLRIEPRDHAAVMGPRFEWDGARPLSTAERALRDRIARVLSPAAS